MGKIVYLKYLTVTAQPIFAKQFVFQSEKIKKSYRKAYTRYLLQTVISG